MTLPPNTEVDKRDKTCTYEELNGHCKSSSDDFQQHYWNNQSYNSTTINNALSENVARLPRPFCFAAVLHFYLTHKLYSPRELTEKSIS